MVVGKGREGKGRDGKGRCRERLARPGGSLISRFLPQITTAAFHFRLLSFTKGDPSIERSDLRGRFAAAW